MKNRIARSLRKKRGKELIVSGVVQVYCFSLIVGIASLTFCNSNYNRRNSKIHKSLYLIT